MAKRLEFHTASLRSQPGSLKPAVKIYIIEVSLDLLSDPTESAYLANLPTSLSLPPEATRRLRIAGANLLNQSETFQELREDIQAGH